MTVPTVERWAGLTRDVDAALERHIDAIEDLPDHLRDAVRYTMLGAGKRLRPILVLLAADAVGGRRDDAIDPACGLEFIHGFSLVHDDLPALDDDDLRRGRPTLHVHAGEAMAILTGDLLLNQAYEMTAMHPAAETLHREFAAATRCMIIGQAYDTLGGFPDGTSDEHRLELIHRNKTGALLRAACRVGAIVGNGTPEHVRRLSDFGETIGLMFQIVDDLLDVTQSTEHLGKGSGKDASAGKRTWPGVHGIEVARARVESLRAEAETLLAPLGEAAEELGRLTDFLAVRTR